MNAGKLENLLLDLSNEVKNDELPQKLKGYHSAFSLNITQPNEQNSTNFSSIQNEFYSLLEMSLSNTYPPSQKRIMDIIGSSPYFGRGLRSALSHLLEENANIPGQAVAKVAEFVKNATEYYTLIINTQESLKKLGITALFTKENEYEIGILLPSKIYKGNVEGLSKELHFLDRHLKTFGEMAGQDTSSPTIRATASGSFDIFVNALPDVAVAIADAVEKIVVIYLSIIQIREIREKAKNKNIPTEILQKISDHEKTRATEEIDKLAEDLFKRHRKKADGKRDKELKLNLVRALRYIAKRLDEGADFEVSPPDVEPELPADADETMKKKQQEKSEFHDALRSRGSSVKQLPKREQEILALPEPREDLPKDAE